MIVSDQICESTADIDGDGETHGAADFLLARLGLGRAAALSE
jgi:hypothetical protein